MAKKAKSKNRRRKHLRHPEAAAAAVLARAVERNETIANRCAIPGFGYLIVLYSEGGGRHTRDSQTYDEAVIIRNEEMKSGLYFKAWIFSKVWNADMSITADPRDRARQAERWYRNPDSDL